MTSKAVVAVLLYNSDTGQYAYKGKNFNSYPSALSRISDSELDQETHVILGNVGDHCVDGKYQPPDQTSYILQEFLRRKSEAQKEHLILKSNADDLEKEMLRLADANQFEQAHQKKLEFLKAEEDILYSDLRIKNLDVSLQSFLESKGDSGYLNRFCETKYEM